MASQPLVGPERSRERWIGPILSELLVLLLTAACGVVVVTLLVFAPRIFADSRSLTLSGLQSYFDLVRAYLFQLLAGDLGRTQNRQSAGRELLIALRHSLELLAVSMAVALPLGLGWGALLANVRRRLPALLLFGLNTLALSLPSFVVMLLAMEAIANLTQATNIQITYVQGYGLDRHLILPTAVLAFRGAGAMARAVQVAQEDIMRQEWIRAARARGLGGLSLWWRHVLPALRLPLLGSALGVIRITVSGLVIVDYLSGWNGLGRLMLQVKFGTIDPAESQVAAGATIMLVVFFVVVDALGRLALRGSDPRLRELTSER